MKKFLKDIFFSHSDNDHKPHIATQRGVAVIAALALLVFILTTIQVKTLQNSEYFLSAVLPSVLIDLSNDDRLESGLSPLKRNPLLEDAAQMKANHMAENSYFAHTSPDGTTPWYWINQSGYKFRTAGENLAVHFTDSREVEEAWMNSPRHRDNILNQNYTEIGIATARGTYEGYNTVFVVQMFGSPSNTPRNQPRNVAAETPDVVETESVQTTEPSGVAGASFEESFVAVEQVEEESESRESEATKESAASVAGSTQSSFLERAVSQPMTTMHIIYFILSAILIMTLVSMLISEAREKHAKHVGYVALTLAFVLLLLFVVQPFIFSDVVIAQV